MSGGDTDLKDKKLEYNIELRVVVCSGCNPNST